MNGTAIFGKSVGEEIKNVQNKKHAEDAAVLAGTQPKLTTSPTQSNSLDAYRANQIDIIDEQFKRLDSNYAEEKRNKDLTKLILNNSETSPTQTTPETKPSTKPEEVKTKTKKGSKDSSSMAEGKAFLNELLDKKGIEDPDIRAAAFGLADYESGFGINKKGPKITDPNNMHYGDQARSIFQIMPKTFAGMPEYKNKDINNNKIAAEAGLDYFLQNYKKYGNMEHTIVAHHAGDSRVQKWKSTGELTGGSKYVTNKQYLAGVKNRISKYKDNTNFEFNGTPSESSPIENDAGTLIAKNTATPINDISTNNFEAFSPEWLENIVNKVTRDSPYNMSIDKLRSMPFDLINAPPKFAGSELNRASREIQTAKNKAPEVIINAPTVNNATNSGGTNNANKEVQMATIVDTEFLQILVGRTVDLFSFGANVT
jgi:hypothetical protein